MADTPSFVEKYFTGKDAMFGRLKQNSLAETLKQNFKFKDGNGIYAFGRVAGIGVGATLAYDAMSRSVTDDGQERSGLVRLTEFIVGGGLAVGSVLAGKGK